MNKNKTKEREGGREGEKIERMKKTEDEILFPEFLFVFSNIKRKVLEEFRMKKNNNSFKVDNVS